MRRLIIVALAGLLAACSSSGTRSPSLQTAPSTAPAPSSAPSSSSRPAPSTSSRRPKPKSTPTPTRTPKPSSSAITTHPPTSADTPRPVRNGTVVLNPGHNGGNGSHTAEINREVPAGYGAVKACDTTGTNTNAGYPEHAFTFDVALRVRSVLQSHGLPVIMTRSDDSGVGPCVDERAAIGNRSGVAAVVSIHADGAPSSGHGFHVNQDSRTPDGATQAVARSSYLLGQRIHSALESSSGLVPSNYIGQDGYYYRSDLAGLNLARRPATFLELGNMRNSGDAALLSSASGRARIAAAIAAGILAFLGR